MGDEEGEFEEEVGDVRVFEYEDYRGHWIEVVTEFEQFSNDPFTWRVEVPEQVDTSEEGVIRLQRYTDAHFSIESDELYEWFTSEE